MIALQVYSAAAHPVNGGFFSVEIGRISCRLAALLARALLLCGFERVDAAPAAGQFDYYLFVHLVLVPGLFAGDARWPDG